MLRFSFSHICHFRCGLSQERQANKKQQKNYTDLYAHQKHFQSDLHLLCQEDTLLKIKKKKAFDLITNVKTQETAPYQQPSHTPSNAHEGSVQ